MSKNSTILSNNERINYLKKLKQIKDNMLLMSLHFISCPLFRIGGITGYTSKRSSKDDWQSQTAAISTTPLYFDIETVSLEIVGVS